MREDEKFVIQAVAAFCSGSWRPGEDPPDAYIDIGSKAIAVEISTLTQHVTTDRGIRERLSDDQTAARLANELNEELKHVIPDGTTVGLHLSSPIAKLRKTKTLLAQRIAALIEGAVPDGTELKLRICDNDVALWVTQHNDPQYKKVSAVFHHRHSNPHILRNAAYALEDRIKTKTKKCVVLKKRPLWLALLNDYWLADTHTYSLAIAGISVEHPFEKILMVSGNGSVSLLHDCAPVSCPL
jgi:hypothetical protein